MQATDILRIDPVEPARFERDGDLLYIPSLWWHQARSLTTSFAVNQWWLKGPKVAVARLAELYMRVRGLKL